MKFRIVFWDVLPCKMIVDNQKTILNIGTQYVQIQQKKNHPLNHLLQGTARRERLPAATAQPAKVRRSCSATDLFYLFILHV
jgi:hypothetical protein